MLQERMLSPSWLNTELVGYYLQHALSNAVPLRLDVCTALGVTYATVMNAVEVRSWRVTPWLLARE